VFGLLKRDMDNIITCISKLKEIEKVVVFGSRAMGNYKKGSDVDLAVMGQKVNRKTIIKLSEDLNEVYPLPYFFDILDYKEIYNKDLKNHIDIEGREIYSH